MIFFNFAFKTHGTLKMLILGAQDNSHIILSYYVEGHLKKNSNLNFMSSIDFQASKISIFLGSNTVKQVLKPFSDRYNSLELPGFRLYNSLLYVLEESRELRALISWDLV